MTLLATMPDMKWKVHCYDAKDSWNYRYTFTTKNRTVTWYDLANGLTGGGNWSVSGGKLNVNWWSGTTEKWGVIDTEGMFGDTRMDGKPYRLDAVPMDFIEAPVQEFLSDEAFITSTFKASQQVSLADSSFRGWIAHVTKAYSAAWEGHQKVLKDISATQQLAQDLLLGFALAFVGGGVGGQVGKLMEKVYNEKYMIDALKDLGKYAVRGPMSAALKQPPAKSMPSSPAYWRAEMEADITDEITWIKRQIVEWRVAVENGMPWEYRPTNPEKEVCNLLKVTLKDGTVFDMLAVLPPVNEDALQASFERGWITAWIKAYGKTLTYIPVARSLVLSKLIDYGESVGASDVRALLEKYSPDVEPVRPEDRW